ncbi:MAG: DUF11 domain-containing protein, partial [Caldilineaceae bacterium]|nr:DUF11 domain-containing protein [Caldilineaceae bacterium]
TVKGADVTYVIDVFNQGSVDAFDIKVVDYLTDTVALSENDSNGWLLVDTNQLQKSIPGPLAPNASERLTITLRISNTAALGPLDNYAEIIAASDIPAGPPTRDVDSAPDAINGNDPLLDDEINDSGLTDQDDHDVATVTIGRFDLALTKTIQADGGKPGSGGDPQDASIGVGEQITFTLTVYNQGDVDAYDVRVTDVSPQGLIIDDSDLNFNILQGWEVANETIGHRVIPGPIAPNTSASINVVMYLVPPTSPFYPAGGYASTLINWGEISAASNIPGGPAVFDEDSTPDEDATNDAGGQPGSAADNYVDGDGTGAIGDGNAATDEDDHDPAQFTVVPSFDLAIVKYPLLDTIGQNAMPIITATQAITYEYVIINQGIQTAQDITLMEHIPDGLILNDPNWTPSNVIGPGTATRTYSTINLTSGNGYTDTVLFQASPTIAAGQIYTNIIEIESATGPGGDPNVIDIDSIPDSDGFNEIVIKDDFFTDNYLANPAL